MLNQNRRMSNSYLFRSLSPETSSLTWYGLTPPKSLTTDFLIEPPTDYLKRESIIEFFRIAKASTPTICWNCSASCSSISLSMMRSSSSSSLSSASATSSRTSLLLLPPSALWLFSVSASAFLDSSSTKPASYLPYETACISAPLRLSGI